MLATFLANILRDLSVLAPSLKPAVSAQPPMAMQTLAPSSKRERTSLTGLNGVYTPAGSEAKSDELAKAVMT